MLIKFCTRLPCGCSLKRMRTTRDALCAMHEACHQLQLPRNHVSGVFRHKNLKAPSTQNRGVSSPSTGVAAPPSFPPQVIPESPLHFRLGFSSGFQHIAGQSPTRPHAGHHAVMLGRMSHTPSYQSASVARAQVSASGSASPTAWQRGHTSVASLWAGLKSSANKLHPLSATQRAPSAHPSAAPAGGSQVVPSEPTRYTCKK